MHLSGKSSTKKLKDRKYSISTEERNKDGNNTHSIKRLKLSAISDSNPAFDGNISKLWDNQPNNTQFL